MAGVPGARTRGEARNAACFHETQSDGKLHALPGLRLLRRCRSDVRALKGAGGSDGNVEDRMPSSAAPPSRPARDRPPPTPAIRGAGGAIFLTTKRTDTALHPCRVEARPQFYTKKPNL